MRIFVCCLTTELSGSPILTPFQEEPVPYENCGKPERNHDRVDKMHFPSLAAGISCKEIVTRFERGPGRPTSYSTGFQWLRRDTIQIPLLLLMPNISNDSIRL